MPCAQLEEPPRAHALPMQDWTDIMPAKRLDPSPIKFHGEVNASTFTTLSQYWIDHYFPLPNYLTAPSAGSPGQQCPIVSIYQV